MSGPSLSSVFGLLHSQLTYKAPMPSSTFQGQTVIVTGANAGLGREVVKHLVRVNASQVILAVRNTSKGEAAREYVEKETGRKDCMDVWHLDMASFDSVKTFAERAEGLERLDVVIANAGVWPTRFELAEGHEATITINVISTFLLTRLLLPKLQATALSTQTTPRVTILTSTLHKFATLPARKADHILEELKKPITDFNGRYNDSKLLVMLYGEKLAASAGPHVCLSMTCPGYCISSLKPPGNAGERVAEKVMARSTDEGARIIVDAVAFEKTNDRKGAFVSDMKVKKHAAWIDSKEGQQTAERVWKELNEILVNIAPELSV